MEPRRLAHPTKYMKKGQNVRTVDIQISKINGKGTKTTFRLEMLNICSEIKEFALNIDGGE